MLEDQLPSEQDRKATLGCLAAILNITFASHQRVDIVSNTISNGGGSSGSLKSQGEDDTNKSIQDDTTEDSAHDMSNNFTIRDDSLEDDTTSKSFMSRSATQKQHQQQAIRRTKAFQKELLNISAELLFLSPDNAKVFLPNLDIQCTDSSMENELLLQPFLQSFSNSTESLRCVTLLMFRFLLLSAEEKPKKQNDKKKKGSEEVHSELEKMTIVGYDSRVRYAFKYLTVSILSYWEMKDHSDFMTYPSAIAYSTRKFEALEEGIVLRLSILQQQMMMDNKNKNSTSALSGQKKESTMKQNVIRGLKVGGAGVAAGTLFAITGGLAAPAIVGGIAAITGASSAVAVVATVLLLPAATTIFGVGGGTLVASKMSKRTAGLEEFDIVKISSDADDANKDEDGNKKKSSNTTTPDLSRTVCISGWLKDVHDFQRPFGTTPSKLDDSHELFCRFCSVYQPDVIPECGNILKEWQGKEDELWEMCKSSYGKDPSTLLPLTSGPRYDAKLIESETKAVDDLIRIIGLPYPEQSADESSVKPTQEHNIPPTVNLLSDVLVSKSTEQGDEPKRKINDTLLRSYKAWDFKASYGSSELYVIQWESELLMELYGSSKEFQKDLAKKAAGEVAKKTALASLMTAVFVPSLILSLSNMIDEKWTLATERADEAGVLLAQSLLNSTAGHRPVSLVGFSFGGRMIISCLKELARNQLIWQRETNETNDMSGSTLSKAASFRKSLSSMSIKQNEEVEFSREPASIVEDVVLMGTVASVNASSWTSCRGVVAGRIVNCYSTKDMILALMYRSKNLTTTVLNPPVGISSVKAPGVENYDVSHLVSGHGEYAVAVQEILQLVGYNEPTKANV